MFFQKRTCIYCKNCKQGTDEAMQIRENDENDVTVFSTLVILMLDSHFRVLSNQEKKCHRTGQVATISDFQTLPSPKVTWVHSLCIRLPKITRIVVCACD